MQLKRIELQGFKSFADRTIIEVEQGITTIVGPNGSGKSNIADAIKWVLGEQSAKSLRGNNMLDVIFSGTEQRKSLGMAEVTLVLDNSDGILPIEYQEVLVTRRVYRSGESEYYINKTASRLKDIQELFMDTGVGRDGYSIIGQGKIDNIISSKSEERRNIFEEASGIVKYKTRKDEALKKLENTNTNLDRVKDILQEIENNLEPMQEKSKTAKKYLELRDELKNIDIKLFVDLVDNTSSDLYKLNTEIDNIEESIKQNEGEIENIQHQSDETRVALEELLSETQNKQETYYKLLNDKDRISTRIGDFSGRMDNAKSSIDKLGEEITESKTSIDVLQQELVSRNVKKDTMLQNKMKFSTELAQKQLELKELVANMSEKELEIEELKVLCEQNKDKVSNIKLEMATNDTKIEAAFSRISAIDDSHAKDIQSSDAITLEVEQIQSDYNGKKTTLEKIQKKVGEENNLKQELEQYFLQISSKEEELKQRILEAKSKLGYMTNLENENAGYILSVKSIMDLSKRNEAYKGKVFGTVAGLVSTDEKYEKAIEITMGSYLQNIVVDTDKTAKELVQFLKDGALGRATFLPVESIRLYKEEITNKAKSATGYIGNAIDLVSYDKKYEAAIRLALGRCIIVDNIENGIRLSKITGHSAKIVTLSGDVIATTGSITGGQASTKQVNLLGRSSKLKQYEKALDDVNNQYLEFQNSFKDKKDKLDSITSQLVIDRAELERANIEYSVVAERLSQILKEKDKLKNSREHKDDEKAELNAKIEALKAVNIELQKHMDVINEDIERHQQEISEYTRFNKEKQERINLLNEDVMNLKISVSSFDESAVSMDEMLEKISQDISNFYNSIERKEQLIEEYKNELLQGENNNQKDKEELKTLEVTIEKTFNELEQLKQDKAINIAKQSELEKMMLEVVGILDKLKNEKAKIENRKSKYDTEIEMLKVKMWEEYELTSMGAKELAKGLTYLENETKPKLEARANKLKTEIKALGDVSVSAIQEYKELSERHEFIQKQKIDLEEAKQKLENLIDNTTSIMKIQFAKQFEIINNNFRKVFSELFGGGRAELKLTDEKNVLESGIDIVAEPPGKKLQNISLLSGGEKALTAIAILFAILKIKSPPFCILDEIEAALDDINVARFASYIKKYSDETQFLVITHRKGTMEIASSVYGVTMQEYGISKLISMKMK